MKVFRVHFTFDSCQLFKDFYTKRHANNFFEWVKNPINIEEFDLSDEYLLSANEMANNIKAIQRIIQ